VSSGSVVVGRRSRVARLTGLVMVASASVWVAAPAQATSCSITAYDPTSNGTTVTAHVLLNCNGPLTGWVKSTLVRVRTGLPDAVVASNTDSTQNSSYNFNAYASGCTSGSYGWKTVGDSSLGYTASTGKVVLSCG